MSKLAVGRSLELRARRDMAGVSRGICGVALLLASGCTDSRVVKRPPVASGSGEAGVVEAGVTSGNATESDASNEGTSTTGMSATDSGETLVTTDTVESTSEVVESEAGATSSMTPPSEQSDGGASTMSDAEASVPTQPSICENLPAAPVPFYGLYGFERSEDFAFDELGNYVGVDSNSNLVRVSQVGRRQLWAPNIAGTTAGMSILPDGSVVVCDVGEGSIKRVYPNGAIVTVLGGLEYPNGLDIGPDGFIYVAENNAGRVRRIDPDTGKFTIVAIGLFGPNGVAFGDDPSIMYIGSFEGSGVYRVDIPAPGELGQARVLARPNGSDLPDPKLACPDQVEGKECHVGFSHGALGKCQRVANVVDCFRYDSCPELPDGTACDYPEHGACSDGVCTVPCADAEPWDSCLTPYGNEQGVCAPQYDGSLSCRPPSPCDQLEDGDACSIDDVPGTCSPVLGYYYDDGIGDSGELYCRIPGPCAGKDAGDECTTDDLPGTCEDQGGAELTCVLPPPCDGKVAGDECEPSPGVNGECFAGDFGLECLVANPCDGQEDGAACVDPYNQLPGTCIVFDYSQEGEEISSGYCEPNDPCAGHAAGEACTGYEGPGVCVEAGYGSLYCEAPPCEGMDAGDKCFTAGSSGTCVSGDGGAELSCYVRPPCENKEAGDSCPLSYYHSGVCTQGDDGLTCESLPPCYGSQAGDSCYADQGEGECVQVDDALECVTPCGGRSEGDACEGPNGEGFCVDRYGYLSCEPPNPCANLTEGDACTASFGAGTCTVVGGSSYYPPYYYDPFTGATATAASPESPASSLVTPVVFSGGPLALSFADGGLDGGLLLDASPGSDAGYADASPGVDAAAVNRDAASAIEAGTYPEPWPSYDAGAPPPWPSYDAGVYPEPEPSLECLPTGDCSTLPDGAACATSQQQLGTCYAGTCHPQESPGGIDGLGVDVCGNVYAAEYVVGNVWRISPDGTTELIAKLPSSWIPNIKWGRGIGGFERDIMYIADRNEGRLFGVEVGLPGATEFFDIGNQ
jgi:sugar lactone lactonase YvrE